MVSGITKNGSLVEVSVVVGPVLGSSVVGSVVGSSVVGPDGSVAVGASVVGPVVSLSEVEVVVVAVSPVPPVVSSFDPQAGANNNPAQASQDTYILERCMCLSPSIWTVSNIPKNPV